MEDQTNARTGSRELREGGSKGLNLAAFTAVTLRSRTTGMGERNITVRL